MRSISPFVTNASRDFGRRDAKRRNGADPSVSRLHLVAFSQIGDSSQKSTQAKSVQTKMSAPLSRDSKRLGLADNFLSTVHAKGVAPAVSTRSLQASFDEQIQQVIRKLRSVLVQPQQQDDKPLCGLIEQTSIE